MKINEGDIFLITISEKLKVVGQIIYNEVGPNPLFVALYRSVIDNERLINLDEILDSEIIFLTNTLDAKLWNGDWKIIDNREPNSLRIPLPYFKYGTGDNTFIENYRGNKRRRATKEEDEILDYRFSVAPKRVENAIKAYFNYMPWEKKFDKLTFKYVKSKSNFVI